MKKHIIRNFFRGDVEDMTEHSFDTRDEAWDFVRKSIEMTAFSFENGHPTYPKSEIDFEKVRNNLFENGQTNLHDVDYCKCPAWFDNWMYEEVDGYGNAESRCEKVYVLVEICTLNANDLNGHTTHTVKSVHRTIEVAKKALEENHDDTICEIIGGDENNLSRVSADDWDEDGLGFTVLADSMQEYRVKIVEMYLED